MQSWAAPDIPYLPGTGQRLRVYDSASRTPKLVEPGVTARMYVCGITPYDATHLGHAFTYVVFDVINRVLRDAGHEVHYTQNVTDVDDPLLERAAEIGEDWRTLADREIQVFRDDMAALRVLPPRDLVGAVEAVPLIADSINRLKAKGAVYELESDLYFHIHAAPHFGEVSSLGKQRMRELFAERGGDPDRPGKKDPLDPLLWRAARQGEPAWDSPLGRGRPGWHIECSAICLDRLGTGIDITGGGNDLIFPHHEMGTAHAEVETGEHPHSHCYVHGGMVGVDGEKMSKSLGNLVFVSRLRGDGGPEPMTLRLALLAHHYRADWQWEPEELERAARRFTRWRMATVLPAGPSGERLLEEVRRRLTDDLDTPGALEVIDEWADAAATAGADQDAEAPTLMRDMVDALLGVKL